MANEIQIFNNPAFGEVRVVMDESNEPMFCLADVCNVLGLDPSQVVKRLSDGVVTIHPTIDALGREQKANFINEDGLYDVILDSRKKKARMFRKWVTSEVLPSIRKTGGYLVVSDSDTEAEILARAVLVAQDTLKRREQRIAQLESDNKALVAINHEQAEAISEMTPKVNYCDVILASPTTVLVTEIAQDYGMSARKLNKLLHTMGIQHKVGRSWVLYAKYLTEGYVQSYTEPNKNSRFGGTFTYSKWTQKGRIFLYNELKNRGILPLIERTQCPF